MNAQTMQQSSQNSQAQTSSNQGAGGGQQNSNQNGNPAAGDAKQGNGQEMDYSKHFAALARKERQLRDRENLWKQEKESFKPKIEGFERFNNLFSQAKTKDPKAIKEALDVLGLSAADISEVALNNAEFQEDPKIAEMRSGYEQMKKELEELKGYRTKKEQEEIEAKESQQFNEIMGTLKSKVKELFDSNPEKYDLCSCLGEDLYGQILEYGDEHMSKNDGEILPLDKILEMLETREEQRLSRFKTSKKFGNPAAGNSNQDNSGTIPPTLNNNINGNSQVDLTGLTGNARMNAIIKKFQK